MDRAVREEEDLFESALVEAMPEGDQRGLGIPGIDAAKGGAGKGDFAHAAGSERQVSACARFPKSGGGLEGPWQ
jgi:hypothetical protein